ncbi:MAG: hypothetical protein ACK53L_25275, partial [Pirellulaceae bacterium]
MDWAGKEQPEADWIQTGQFTSSGLRVANQVASTQGLVDTDPQWRLRLEGGFGFGGYGSKTVKNTFGLALIREYGSDMGNYKEAVQFASRGHTSSLLE